MWSARAVLGAVVAGAAVAQWACVWRVRGYARLLERIERGREAGLEMEGGTDAEEGRAYLSGCGANEALGYKRCREWESVCGWRNCDVEDMEGRWEKGLDVGEGS